MNPWLESTRWVRYTLLVLAGLGGVLLFLLASASNNSDLFEENYPVLITLNGLIAAGLFGVLMLHPHFRGSVLHRLFKILTLGTAIIFLRSITGMIMKLMSEW